MSEKGGGGGGRASRAGGRGPPSTGGGNRNSHFKVMASDPKYGMLLWQSKLQEKLLKEQKESKAQGTMRRKSDEEYHTYTGRPVNGGEDHTSRSKSRQEGGESSGGEITTSSRHVPNSVSYKPTSLNHHPTSPPTLLVTTAEEDEGPSSSGGLMENEDTGRESRGDGGGGFQNRIHLNAKPKVTHYGSNYTTGRESGVEVSSPDGRESFRGAPGYQYYRRDQPMLPKLVTTKLNSSVSCDNLATNLHQLYGNPSFFGASVGGAGAPRRSPSGKVVTNLQGHPEIRYHQKDTRGFDQTLRYMMDRDKITKYREDLDKQVEEKQSWTRRMLGSPNSSSGGLPVPIKIMSSHDRLHEIHYQDQQHQQPPSYPRESGGGFGGDTDSGPNSSRRLSRNGIELAPLIRKYKSLPKLNTLSSTDVTKPFVPSPRRSDMYSHSPEPEEVARGLAMQLAEKHKIHQIHQENEKLAAERHFNTWDSFWGRPGHGAPIFYSRNSPIGASTPSLVSPRGGQPAQFNKVDLFKAIHMTHQLNKPSNQ